MEVTSIDSNTWYTLMNYGTDRYFSYNTSSSDGIETLSLSNMADMNWHFLDPSVVNGGSSSGWLMRAQGDPYNCLDWPSGSSYGIMDACSESSPLWQIDQQTPSSDPYALTIYNSALGYLSAGCADCFDLQLLSGLSSNDDFADAEFAFTSMSAIDDSMYSTLPYTVSTTDSPTTTTDSYSTTTDDTYSTTTTDDTYSTTTPDDTPTPVPTAAPAPTGTPNINISIIDKNVADLGLIAAALLPAHSNIGCENCTIVGTIDVTTSPLDTGLGDLETVAHFLENGYVDVTTSNLHAEIAFDVQLLPGFTFVDTFLTIAKVPLANVSITEVLNLEFDLELGLPLKITLDSPITFTGGFTLDVNQANLRIDFGDPSDSSATGFDAITVGFLPAHISASNLALSATSGLGLKISTTATVDVSEDISTSGSVTFEIDFPAFNITAAVESNVDNNCNPASSGTVHKNAIGMYFDTGVDISAEGELEVECDGVTGGVKADLFPEFSYIAANASQCLYDDRLKANFLSGDTTGGAGLGSQVRLLNVLCIAFVVGSWLIVL